MHGHIVLASTKSGFIPNAIKWMTCSQFSHSFVSMPDLLGFPMCIEAAETGVDMARFDINYAQNLNQGYQVWKVKVSPEIKEKALSSIINDLEISYGMLQYPWFMWRALNRLIGRDIKVQNNWSSQGMICSQLCVAYLNACNLQSIFTGYGLGSIAPQDLQDIFLVHPELFELVEQVRL